MGMTYDLWVFCWLDENGFPIWPNRTHSFLLTFSIGKESTKNRTPISRNRLQWESSSWLSLEWQGRRRQHRVKLNLLGKTFNGPVLKHMWQFNSFEYQRLKCYSMKMLISDSENANSVAALSFPHTGTNSAEMSSFQEPSPSCWLILIRGMFITQFCAEQCLL